MMAHHHDDTYTRHKQARTRKQSGRKRREARDERGTRGRRSRKGGWTTTTSQHQPPCVVKANK
jgi:hypothetical protein